MSRYERLVPRIARLLARKSGWSKPNWYIESGDVYADYPPAAVEILRENYKPVPAPPDEKEQE